jgi:hypothetical protein
VKCWGDATGGANFCGNFGQMSTSKERTHVMGGPAVRTCASLASALCQVWLSSHSHCSGLWLGLLPAGHGH